MLLEEISAALFCLILPWLLITNEPYNGLANKYSFNMVKLEFRPIMGKFNFSYESSAMCVPFFPQSYDIFRE